MAPKAAHAPPNDKKRKDAPAADTSSKPKAKRQKLQRDARTLAVQTTSKAFKNGELDVDKFVKAREYEIKALEEGLQRSKKALSTRAFQQVPKELRRRTASHNAQRVPKRLRGQARGEMADDNTPTVTARRRKPTRHMRLRIETVKKLRALGSKRKVAQEKAKDEEVKVVSVEFDKKYVKGKFYATAMLKRNRVDTRLEPAKTEVKSRVPRIKKNILQKPETPKAKFRKRQVHKTWLPTHLFHAKRAHMTPPREPLWRFAIPLTPTAKSYRPTHRAVSERGAVAWDMSYMSTIALEGVQKSLENLLKGLGVGGGGGPSDPFGTRGQKWRSGTRTWQGWLHEREGIPKRLIAPATVIWKCQEQQMRPTEHEKPAKRTLLIRVHPSAFNQLWDEVLRLCKIQKPEVLAEDLRFEIGSIEITGPGATEALQAALWPSDIQSEKAAQVWKSLETIENPSILPTNTLLSFSVTDPRLHHPPRRKSSPVPEDRDALLHMLANWPLDKANGSTNLFDAKIRRSSMHALPSQKAINRRKAEAAPGAYPNSKPGDPRIPVVLYVDRQFVHQNSPARESSWTLLLPWKAVMPVWYSLMYYPLSTGGQVRFGGLNEQRQVAFESGCLWYPGDYPGTEAGSAWEVKESARRKREWERRPKGKRVEYTSLDLGAGKKGEIGEGWACDWARLTSGPPPAKAPGNENGTAQQTQSLQPRLLQALLPSARSCLSSTDFQALPSTLVSVRITYTARGVPNPCARIYRIPYEAAEAEAVNPADKHSSGTNMTCRNAWLFLLRAQKSGQAIKNHAKYRLPIASKNVPHVAAARLAAELLGAPPTSATASEHEDNADHPSVPGEEDLIGFVNSGEYCLSEGKGIGIGSLLLSKIVGMYQEDNELRNICIVRNAGESTGRLARWELV